MPYIKDINGRKENLAASGELSPDTSGELNYVITGILLDYLENKGLSYSTCNDIVGALDNAKDEFRRRVQHPYEDMKIKENGDVYPARYLARSII